MGSNEKQSGKREREVDYRAVAGMGIILIAMGVTLGIAISPILFAFLGLGVVFMAIGLANRDKWKESPTKA